MNTFLYQRGGFMVHVVVKNMGNLDEIAWAVSILMSRGKVIEELNCFARGELFVLKYLYAKAAPASPSELSEALNSSTSRISAALGTLEKKGQIHREIDPSNRRFILVTLTDDGRKRISTVAERMRKHLFQVLTEMGEDDAREFLRLATRFFEIAERTMSKSTHPPGR
jgi:DNA-binding MarR family transcriptional regulator